MVYGFVKQSGGHVGLYSEEGRGTTVSIYLPRAEQAVQQTEAPPAEPLPRGTGEVILVIEDDADVRALVVKQLEDLGFRTVEADDAQAAQRALADGTAVDLVLSDVVLPGGTSGPEFADAARAERPDLKFIFMWWTGQGRAFFRVVQPREHSYYAAGWGHQYAFVFPYLDLVVVHRINTDWSRRFPRSSQVGQLLWLILAAGGETDHGPDPRPLQ